MTKPQQPTRDQQLVIALLCGRQVHDRRGLPRPPVYLKEGSADELEARRAFERLLRTSRPLDHGLRVVLADLISPDRNEINRRIRFVNRRKGKESNALADKEVAQHIETMLHDGGKARSTKYAISKAEEKFGLKRSRLLDIWKEWKPILQRLKR